MKIEEEIDSEFIKYQQLMLIVKKGESKDVLAALIRENDDQELSGDVKASLESKTIDDSVFRIEDLDEESLEKLLGELLKDQHDPEESLQQNYLIREQTLKPPEPGTIEIKNQIEFPPKSVSEVDQMMNSVGNQLAENALEKKKAETFKIIRAVPTGKQDSEVASVPFISITFSHEMIEEFDAEPKSFEEIDFVEISPLTENVKEGKWKWVGTKSLVFQPRFRFDRSTEFTYKILKEKTKSVHGHTLEEGLSATFKTPTARVISCVPSDHSYQSFPISNLPFLFFQFDQDIDKQSVIEKLEITVSSSKIGVELFEDTSIISKMLEESDYLKKFPYCYNLYHRPLTNVIDPKRTMWVKLLIANETLHAGKNYRKIGLGEYMNIYLKQGFKSLEGPLLSIHDSSTGVYGYAKMAVISHYPKKHFFYNEIYPGCSFSFTFNNYIDFDKVESIDKFVQIEPALNNYKVTASENVIVISGDTLAREKYHVVIKKGVPDIYNQVLEADYSTNFEVSGEDREFNMSLPTFCVMPPCLFDNNEPFLYFDTVNIQETHVVISQVDPVEMYQECLYPKFAPKTLFNSYDNYQYFDWNPRKPQNFGTQVFDQKVQIENFVKDRNVSTKIMLPQYLQNGKTGSLLVHFKPKRSILYSLFTGYQARWVQVSNLCVDVICITGEKFGVFVSDFSTGKPVDNAEVTLFDTKAYYPDKEKRDMEVRTFTQKTNERGMAYFDYNQSQGYHIAIAVSKDKDQVVYTNPSVNSYSLGQHSNVAHIFNDRGLYKPNETVHMKGFIRKIIYDTKKDSENYATYSITTQLLHKVVDYEIYDSRGVKYLDGKVELSVSGSFVLDLTLPDNVNLGSHNVTFKFEGQRFNHTFKVEEFRTREYNVTSSIIPSSEKVNLFVGDKLINKVSAKYYSGGGLSNSNVYYSISTASKNFTPEGWSNYVFQETDLRSNYKLDTLLNNAKAKTQRYRDANGTTDSSGDDHLSIVLWDPEKIVTSPIGITCKANVQDINRQTQGTSTDVILHSCKYYVGVRCVKRVVMKSDENIDCYFVVTDIKGKIVKDIPISVKLVKFGYDSKGYEKWETTNSIKEITLTSQDQPLLHTFTLSEETNDTAYGEYAILCEVKEEEVPIYRSGINRCSIPIRKFGYIEHLTSKGYTSLSVNGFELIANKFENDEYEPGEDAKIYIVSPFGGECIGFAWILCNGLVKQETFDISSDVGMHELTIPIKKEYRPNIQVKVQLFGKENYIDVDEKTRVNPTHGSGAINIQISKSSHELDITVTPKDTILSPGKDTSVTVNVKDKQGNNVANSEVCLIVCDQAVLDMANHSIEDPLSMFIINNSCGYNFNSIRDRVRYWLYPRKNQRDLEIMQMNQQSLRLLSEGNNGRQKFQQMEVLEDQCAEIQLCKEECCCKKSCSLFSLPLGGLSCSRRRCESECCDKLTCSSSTSSISGGRRGCAMPSMNDRKEAFQIRNNFKPDAAFIGFAHTDENGCITLDFKLTDALTKFKVTAVVNAKEDLFGIGSSAITTNLPIAVRPSMPRFLNYGDLCDLTYVLQNQTDADLTLSLVCHVTNLRIFNGKDKNQRKKGFTVVIPAQGRKEIRVPVQVLKCGKALINLGVRVVRAVAKNPEKQDIANDMVGWSDAVKNDFKIFTPATNEAFATYGDVNETNDNALQPISLPSKNILAHFGEFSVSTSTTALSTLTDSLIYLYSYPYECNEQIASKLLGIVSMKEMILQFYTPEELKKLMDISGREEIDAFVDSNLAKLFERQRYDGAFSYWSNNLIGDPFLTCHVALCFAKCKSEGYKIPDQILERTKSILKNISSLFFFGFLWPRVIKDTIKAYAYYILSLLADNEKDKEQVISLCEGVLDHYNTITELTKELNPESAAYLAMAIHKCKKEQVVEERKGFFAKFTKEKVSVHQWLDAIKSYFKENVTVDSGIYAHFITNYEDNELAQMVMLHSNTRTDAVVLGCLMEVDREESSDIIQKLVRSLLAARNSNRYGRWYNTQENSICLISLTDYFKIFEKEVPDMNVNTWLVDNVRPEETLFMGNQSWKGRSRDKKKTTLPLTAFVPRSSMDKEVINPNENDSKKSFLLTKNGAGRLYYRIALSYTPEELVLKSLDRGFSVSRVYEAITNPDDVKFDKTTKTWKVKSGELVRVSVTICNSSRRYNVALVDKMPAGLEAVNPELDTQFTDFGNSGNANELSNKYYYKWFEYQNIRDERVEAFARILYEGSHVYSYICRATTLGSFVAPPTHMEEMYSPECFGRSKTEFVQVYDK